MRERKGSPPEDRDPSETCKYFNAANPQDSQCINDSSVGYCLEFCSVRLTWIAMQQSPEDKLRVLQRLAALEKTSPELQDLVGKLWKIADAQRRG